MPPKKQLDVSKKALQKEAKQTIEDATFGLKNKNKSKKVQQQIQAVQKQVQNKVDTVIKNALPSKLQQSQADILKKQKEDEKRLQQLQMLRSTLKQPPVPEGENPKNYPCILHQYGCCDKAEKCKYSHGEKVEIMTPQQILEEKMRKEQEKLDKAKDYVSEDMGKLDIYREMRDQIIEYRAKQKSFKNGKDYDEVLSEMLADFQDRTRTHNYSDLICKNFIQACRENVIGFGWNCAHEKQQGYCQYRHCIPIDFVLFEKPEDFDEDLDNEQFEEEIERKRNAITQGTPVNEETFAVWKQKRVQQQLEEAEKAEAEKELKIGFTGKIIFAKGMFRAGAEGDGEEQGGEIEGGEMDQFFSGYKKKIAEGGEVEAEAEGE
ncbi:Zinc finger domain-containing protein [Spironucleus salmonicida]|uniref:Zinc finger domain-containing protein n=1 Tax=Spironucleus salmonicida TaxID=348837 RepID=V6M643_9EUKA|nr:Zinc finger domain-containing protein [Spironucleus salmonicida]|eukprot:EST48849.1 Zinc finger domain-containing protein [Spironucleus salmonicida]